MSGHLLGTPHLASKPLTDYTAEELRYVRLMVCAYAHDAGDARLLLDALGLLEVGNA